MSLHQFHQHTTRALRVKKCDEVATCAGSRGIINQPVALLRETLQGCRNIGHAIRDVVEPGAAAVEETLNGGLGRCRLDELDAACATSHECYIDALCGHRFNWCTVRTGDGFKEWQNGSDGRHCNRNMIEREFHGLLRPIFCNLKASQMAGLDCFDK